MVQKIVVTLEDDLDGGEADETVNFALDGRALEIDLSTPNAARLRKTLALYVEKARKVTGRHPRRRAGAPKPATPAASFVPPASSAPNGNGQVSSQEIRAWAATQPDIELKPRGRIPEEIRTRYLKAHGLA